MRRICWVIAGVVLAFTLAGCGESAPEAGPVDYKGTNSAAIDSLRKQMSENMANKNHLKKTQPETKPAPGTKSSEK
jgi:outer membrane PBP1 activator LpoA protein